MCEEVFPTLDWIEKQLLFLPWARYLMNHIFNVGIKTGQVFLHWGLLCQKREHNRKFTLKGVRK